MDFSVAIVLMVLLSLTILVVLQLFNALIVKGGGQIFLDPTDYLTALSNEHSRTDTQYWWIYITVFSTMIPSVVNVTIGLLSITRGFSLIPRWIKSNKLPAKNSVPEANKILYVPLLAFNRVSCVLGGIVLSIYAVYLILTIALPKIGIHLLTMLEAINNTNIPVALLLN